MIEKNKYSLLDATRNNDIETVKFLLEAGVNPDGRRKAYEPPLHIAVANKNKEIVELLLKHGANPEIRIDQNILTSLCIAKENKDEKIIELLKQYGAKERSRDEESECFFNEMKLFGLCENGNLNDLKNFLDEETNYDINAQDTFSEYGETALIKAINGNIFDVNFNHIKVIEMLLDYGADIEATDFCKRTPLMYAIMGLRYLNTHHCLGRDDEKEIRKQMISLLIRKGANVNAQDEDGCYAENQTEILELLKLI